MRVKVIAGIAEAIERRRALWTWREEALFALACGRHVRLGAGSPIRALPRELVVFIASLVPQHVILVGGGYLRGRDTSCSDQVWEVSLHAATREWSWSPRARMPRGIKGAAGAFHRARGKWYVLGGMDESGCANLDLFVYTFAADSWCVVEGFLESARMGASLACYRDMLVLVGGGGMTLCWSITGDNALVAVLGFPQSGHEDVSVSTALVGSYLLSSPTSVNARLRCINLDCPSGWTTSLWWGQNAAHTCAQFGDFVYQISGRDLFYLFVSPRSTGFASRCDFEDAGSREFHTLVGLGESAALFCSAVDTLHCVSLDESIRFVRSFPTTNLSDGVPARVGFVASLCNWD